jgi:hypothetical protein
LITGEMACPQLPHATVGTPGGISSWLLHFGHIATSRSPFRGSAYAEALLGCPA